MKKSVKRGLRVVAASAAGMCYATSATAEVASQPLYSENYPGCAASVINGSPQSANIDLLTSTESNNEKRKVFFNLSVFQTGLITHLAHYDDQPASDDPEACAGTATKVVNLRLQIGKRSLNLANTSVAINYSNDNLVNDSPNYDSLQGDFSYRRACKIASKQLDPAAVAPPVYLYVDSQSAYRESEISSITQAGGSTSRQVLLPCNINGYN